MKFRCERDVLLEALTTAGRAVAGRNASAPVLGSVRMTLEGSRLEVTGTDLELTITAEELVNGESDGVAVAQGRLTADIVRALDPGQVAMEATEDELYIESGRSRFTVRTHSPDEFRPSPVPPGEEVKIPTEGFAEALRQVTRAASNEINRPILTGVLMAAEEGVVRIVATDSYRLAMREMAGLGVIPDGTKVLVPSRAFTELQRLLGGDSAEVTVSLTERSATFKVGGVTMTTRLIEGEFPNYRTLIPSSYQSRLSVSRQAMMDALRRVRLLARESNTPVRLALREAGVELFATTNDWGTATEDVEGKYEGPEITIAFNPAFLMEGLEAISTDDVYLDVNDSLKPATLSPTSGENYIYLLMPVRV